MVQKPLTHLSKLSKEGMAKFLNSIDTILSDCDGVLWRGNEMCDGASLVMNRFRELGKQIVFVTNNPGILREDLVTKCEKFKIICKKEEVLSTAYLVAHYLKQIGFDKTVFVIGLPAIFKELDAVGIKHTNLESEMESSLCNTKENFKIDPEIGGVVVSFDPRFTLIKMAQAASYAFNPNCLFIATHTDVRLPINTDIVVPGPAGIVKSVQTAANRKPFIVGKPNKYLADILIEEYGITPDRTLIIGDSCEIDILLGTRFGFKSLLVLTGVTTFDQVNNYSHSSNDQDLVPDLYTETLGDLLPYLN